MQLVAIIKFIESCLKNNLVRYNINEGSGLKMFKNKIKDLRIENNYTQEELANKIHISRQSISKWENGLSYPTKAKLRINMRNF